MAKVRNVATSEITQFSGFPGAIDPTIVFWGDASDATKINGGSPIDGEKVTTWVDKSLAGNNATQGGGAAFEPTYRSSGFGANNTSYIEFDGTDNFLTLGTTLSKMPEHTVITVFEKDSGGTTKAIIMEGDNAGTSRSAGIAQTHRSGRFEVIVGDGTDFDRSQDVTANGLISTGVEYIYTTRYQTGDSNAKMRVDGINLVPTNQAGAGITAIGGTAYDLNIGKYGQFGGLNFDGKIVEIIIWNRHLSDAELDTIENGLKTKYAIGVTTADLVLHLDATDSSTINSGTPSNNDPVSAWNDKSPELHNATQGTGANQPVYKSSGFGVNNTAYIDFDGAAHFLTLGTVISKLPEHTVITVWEADVITGVHSILVENGNGSSVQNGISHIIRTSRYENIIGDGLNFSRIQDITATGLTTASTPYIFANTYTAGDTITRMWVDGNALTASLVAGVGVTNIGGSAFNMSIGRYGNFNGNYFNGKIAEIKVWDGVISTTDLTNEINALKTKYGI